jgi:hypothetical protein
MEERQESFLRKQAWDYFTVHASQRIAIFNFYVVLSSVTLTTYFASFKSDSNLQSARPVLAGLLCLFAFIFWKLDSRNKFMIKNSEEALKYFEREDPDPDVAKVFTNEEKETNARKLKGWQRIKFWRAHLSYSDCFNIIFLLFFVVGLVGLFSSFCHCGFDKLQQTQTQDMQHYQYQENVNKRP